MCLVRNDSGALPTAVQLSKNMNESVTSFNHPSKCNVTFFIQQTAICYFFSLSEKLENVWKI
jgi:hypothetical protein